MDFPAYYPFSGNANDESGNGNNGVASNTTFTIDRFGIVQRAINSNQASNGYIKTNNVIPNVTNTFSICFWVSPEATDVIKTQGATGQEGYGLQPVIHPSHGGNWGDPNLNAGVGVNVGTNQIQVTEHSFLYISSPLVYATNISGWHHVAIVYNNRVPSLYLDGVLVKTGLMSNRQNVRPSNGFDSQYGSSGFGRSFSPNGSEIGQFKGSFDEIRIYNRVLSSSEIKFLATH